MEETNCQLCATHEIYEGLKAIGTDSKEAFHLAVGYLLENVLENAIEVTYDKAVEVGYDEGYSDATADVAEIVVAYAKSANEN